MLSITASRHLPFHVLLTFVSPRVCSDLGSQGLEELLCVFYQHVFTLMFSHFSLWNVDGTQMFLDLPNLKHQSFDQLWIPVHSFVCMLKVILVETAFDDILVLRLLRPDSARTNLFTNLHKPTVFRSVFPLRPEFAESIAQIHEVKKKVRNHSESAESRSSFSSSLPPKQPGPGISILGSQVYKDPDNRHIEVPRPPAGAQLGFAAKHI